MNRHLVPFRSTRRSGLAGRPAALAVCLALSTLALVTPAPGLVTATVGSSAAGCQFRGLQEAIDFVSASSDPQREVRMTNETALRGVHATIGESMTIVGGFPDCAPGSEPAARRTSLLGSTDLDDATDTVLTIEGPAFGEGIQVTLRGLSVQDGHGVEGGGIRVEGLVDLTLERSLVLGNVANRGGGIYLDGTLGASLDLVASGVNGNRTEGGPAVPSGGGVYCTGSGVVRVGDGSGLFGNEASSIGFGGGIFALGCDVALEGPARLSNNRARSGGGLHALAGSQVLLKGSNRGPVEILFNRAVQAGQTSARGGGLSLTGAGTRLVAEDVEVRGNRVESSDPPSGVLGGALSLGDGAEARFERTLGASCPTKACSLFVDNEAGSGTVAFVSAGARLSLVNTTVESNRAIEDLFLLVDGAAHRETALTLEGVLIVRNVADRLARIIGHGALEMTHTTVASNAFDLRAFHTTLAGSPVPPEIVLRSSILHQPFLDLILSDSGVEPQGECVVVHDDAELSGERILVADPELVVEGGYERLGPTSPAIDLCNLVVGAIARDIDLQDRPFDDPLVPEHATASFFDAGADERAPAPPPGIFSDGFESGGTSAWSGTS